MAYKWFVGTEAQCNELVAAADTYYGYPNPRTKTQTWANPEVNPENVEEFTVPLNDWMLDNLTYDPAKVSDDFPFTYPERIEDEI
jgi:hypothetical protein